MKKNFAFIVMLLATGFYFSSRADASTLSFQNFTAGNGLAISIPYKHNSGTERDPDTVTLTVDLSASVFEFQLTAVGAGFTNGRWCELDWDDDGLGAPREQNVPLSNGGFDVVQKFSIPAARLNLANGTTRTILYELDVDEEPYDSRGDSERHLRVTFVGSGSGSKPSDPSAPSNPSPSGGNDGGGGGGCNTAFGKIAALLLPMLFLRRKSG